jgi:PAS domain S-box-containing protein
MPQLGWTARADGFIDFYNRGWYEYTGTTYDEMQGWGWEKVHRPDMLNEVNQRWKQSLESGTPFEMRFPLRSASGEYRWFLTRVKPWKTSDGKIVRWIGINTDIQRELDLTTDFEQLVAQRTDELVRAQERLSLITDLLSEFVATANYRATSSQLLKMMLRETQSEYGFIGAIVPGGPQGVTLRIFADEGFSWSPSVNRELYEKIMADYEDKGYIDFPRLDNLFGWPILNRKPIITNDPNSDERRSGRTPKGHPPLNSFLGVPLFKGEEVVGAIGVANRPGGYSEEQLKELELLGRAASVIYESYKRLLVEQALLKERDLAVRELKESNQALLDLSYAVSHELQEPLRVIKSELSLLSVRYQGRLGTDADGFISDSQKAADVVAQMLDDLWEYARIDRPHIEFSQINLNEVFDKTLIGLEVEISAKKAKIARDDLPQVYGERRQLATLFRQLLHNAITFNRAPEPAVKVSVSYLVDVWEFAVADNGIGFEPTENFEVFKMFRKLDRDTAGSGMGLAIAKRIVQFHGGTMWAESTKGQGSTFRFTLPVERRR